MDSVRFGRSLGIGARLAGKALSKALEPAPANSANGVKEASVSRVQSTGQRFAESAAHTRVTMQAKAPEYRAKGKAIAHGTKRFGEAIWGPLAHAGRVLWLEVVGVFFAVFALFFGQQTWSRRTDFAYGPEHQHFIAFGFVCAMFLYLSSSSFLRARRKPRKR